MSQKFIVNLKRVSYNLLRNMTTTRSHKHVVQRFIDKVGMIYFGSVNQSKDEHRLIRGFTASSTHHDNHFSVGTVDSYDVSVVDRNDAYVDKNNVVKFNNWLIVAIDLKNGGDIPHLFIQANNHESQSYEPLFIAYPVFTKINLGTFEQYPVDFISRFNTYTNPSDIIEVEKLLPADSVKILGAHLWPYSIEVCDGVVYVYSDDENITHNNLTTMLNVGLWFARHLDYMIMQI